MRDIEFRGLNTSGQWVYGDLIHGVGNCSGRLYILPRTLYYPPGCHELNGWRVNPETVGQYWRTVNGKRLYDGDIFESRMFPDKPKWIVQYMQQEECFCIAHPQELNLKFVYAWQTPDKKWWKEFGDHLYIIGNIHENKELIK